MAHVPCAVAVVEAPESDDAQPFDVALAQHPTIVLACGDVVDLLAVSHAPERVEEYRERMARGERFPPVAVIRLFGRYLLADGHKRFTAYRRLNRPAIVVEHWPLRRWVRDQWEQFQGNARKNLRILALSVSDPRAGWRLLATTLRHWRRVATSLTARAAGRLRG